MDVYNILKKKYNDLDIEKLDYLPMVDRFMETLVGNDNDVGLNLELDDEKMQYVYDPAKKELYEQILCKVGEAFLIRKERRHCDDGELSKVVGAEIYGKADQKKLIMEDERIPGLYDLIKEYKSVNKEYTDSIPQENNNEVKDSGQSGVTKGVSGDSCGDQDQKSSDSDSEQGSGNPNNKKQDNGNEDDSDASKTYIPETKYRAQKTKVDTLYFTLEEARNFRIDEENNYNDKIKSIINDLRQFSIYKHPYTVTLLYRTLLEISTLRVYKCGRISVGRNYSESSLIENVRHLNNNVIFNKYGKNKEISKIKESIKTYTKDHDIIQILNLYIHYEKPVDENLILSSWKSMKHYIQACLEI